MVNKVDIIITDAVDTDVDADAVATAEVTMNRINKIDGTGSPATTMVRRTTYIVTGGAHENNDGSASEADFPGVYI